MLKNLLYLVIAVLCIIALSSPADAQSTYTSKNYDFSIEIPERWSKHIMKSSRAEAVVLAPIGYPASNTNATISIFKPIELCDQFKSIDCYVDSMRNKLVSAKRFKEICEDSTFTINEKKVCRLIAKYEHYKSERMEEHYFFCAENKIYLIVYKAIDPLYERLKDDLVAAVNSFSYQ